MHFIEDRSTVEVLEVRGHVEEEVSVVRKMLVLAGNEQGGG